MTMLDFLRVNPLFYIPTYHKNGMVSIPDRIDENRWQLWKLSDYRVISVSGGTIWLDKKIGE